MKKAEWEENRTQETQRGGERQKRRIPTYRVWFHNRFTVSIYGDVSLLHLRISGSPFDCILIFLFEKQQKWMQVADVWVEVVHIRAGRYDLKFYCDILLL